MQKIVKARILFIDGKVINLDLYPDVAPMTVDNFVNLARSHFYDGLCFHRIIDKFMIQGGGFAVDPQRGLVERNARSIKGEFRANGVENPLGHSKGVISMARTNVPDSASSQFFICVADVHYLDGQYAAFGKCSDAQSIDTAVAIGKLPTGKWKYYSDVPLRPVLMKTIEIL